MDSGWAHSKIELLDALLEGLIDAVIVIDAFGAIQRASRSVEAHFGWTASELEGQNIKVLVPEPHHSNHDAYLERFRKTGKTWILGTVREFEVVRKDGSHVMCELSVSEIPSDGARGALYCGSFRDVTDRTRARQALRRSEAKFRGVFEHENQIVLLLDEDGLVTEANAPALARIGVLPGAVIGLPLHEAPFWSSLPGNRDAVARALEAARQSGLAITRANVCIPHALAGQGKAADSMGAGRSVPADPVGLCHGALPYSHEVSVRVVPSASDGAPSAIVEVRDITDLVESERRESAVIRSLARVGEESAVLAHELRSPVSALELALKAVGRHLGEEDNAILVELAARMRRLEELLNRTLRFSRPLELRLEEITPGAAFGAALNHEAAAIKKGSYRAIVSVEPGTPSLLADPAALNDLLSNLVRNAVEAQPGGGSISLLARPSPTAPGMVRLSVTDEGPGIPESEREAMFRLFRTEKEDGTGLGLALVRKIADEHSATVRLTTGEHGHGLSVILDWPTAPHSH
ncbi:Sensor protein FixL [Planctomycetes bacterium Poly30]|uniref:histidine kinase n=1 Tax=Saltatorellus ferox TaxID=2528018 RepID=A0A518EQU1_9BACT|nr:Sensor protein FixL [Planctomycetes bacterium Poly30]